MGKKPRSQWPAVRFGPGGQEAIFNSEAEVPKGWQDHPSKVGEPEPEREDPKVTPITAAKTFQFEGRELTREDAVVVLENEGFELDGEESDEEITEALKEVEAELAADGDEEAGEDDLPEPEPEKKPLLPKSGASKKSKKK